MKRVNIKIGKLVIPVTQEEVEELDKIIAAVFGKVSFGTYEIDKSEYTSFIERLKTKYKDEIIHIDRHYTEYTVANRYAPPKRRRGLF